MVKCNQKFWHMVWVRKKSKYKNLGMLGSIGNRIGNQTRFFEYWENGLRTEYARKGRRSSQGRRLAMFQSVFGNEGARHRWITAFLLFGRFLCGFRRAWSRFRSNRLWCRRHRVGASVYQQNYYFLIFLSILSQKKFKLSYFWQFFLVFKNFW